MSEFWHQPAAERTLRQAASLGRLSRSFLFAGPDGVGKWAAALWVARAILCKEKVSGIPCGVCRDCTLTSALSHPDLHLLFPVPSSSSEESEQEFREKKRKDPFASVQFTKRGYIAYDPIRALMTELNFTSVEGGAKVVIINSVDQVAAERLQGILLKSIEEPPTGAHFILTSASPERLLATIHSRCQTIRFAPVDPDIIATRLTSELTVVAEQARVIASICGGGWGNAVRLATEDQQSWRELMIEFWMGAFRVRPYEMLSQIQPLFRSGKQSVGFDALLQAYDIWSYCLWRDCERLCSANAPQSVGAPIPDLETGWACWRILQNARSTLYVNVTDRHAIAGTFLALRQRLHVQ